MHQTFRKFSAFYLIRLSSTNSGWMVFLQLQAALSKKLLSNYISIRLPAPNSGWMDRLLMSATLFDKTVCPKAVRTSSKLYFIRMSATNFGSPAYTSAALHVFSLNVCKNLCLVGLSAGALQQLYLKRISVINLQETHQ